MRAPAGQCSSQPHPAPCGPTSLHPIRCNGTHACVRKAGSPGWPVDSGVTVRCDADTSQMMSMAPQLGSVTPFKLTTKVRPAVQGSCTLTLQGVG